MPDNFVLSSYRRILQVALAGGYHFIGFDQIGQESSPYSCILRHDVDSELWGCGSMADIETEFGISSTYFVMLRSTSYNLLCIESLQVMEKLKKGGHHIGLHFMGELCEEETIETIKEKVLNEVRLVEREVGMTIHAVSFHQPGKKILDYDVFIDSVINAYNKIDMRDYFYISDTNMTWRFEHPEEVFARHLYPRLHLLIHPMWWTSVPMSLQKKWLHVLNSNRKVVINHWQRRERSLEKCELY